MHQNGQNGCFTPVSNIRLESQDFTLCGTIPAMIKALIIDVDGTLFKLNHPIFKARRMAQKRWLCARLKLSLPDLDAAIEKEKAKQEEYAEGRRVGFSEIVYGLDPSIECTDWQKVLTQSVPTDNFNCRLAKDPDLEAAITDLTADRARGVRIIFATNASAGTAEIILKMVFGARQFNHGMFGIVGHSQKISKPDPAFFRDIVGPALLSKGVPLRQAVSIGDRLGDDGIAAVQAGVAAAIIVNGPRELTRVLRGLHQLRNRA